MLLWYLLPQNKAMRQLNSFFLTKASIPVLVCLPAITYFLYLQLSLLLPDISFKIRTAVLF